MPAGRPIGFTQKIADAICDRIAIGESVKTICASDDMPSESMVYRWLAANETFREQYARARELQAEHYTALMHEVVEENPQVKIPTKCGSYIATDSAGIARNRLRWDNLRWHASKLAPKKYGDKVQAEVSGPEGGPLQVIVKSILGRKEA